ncbi:hypothetical protein BJX70DRAFT_117303 [Aspergillus crustosus]
MSTAGNIKKKIKESPKKPAIIQRERENCYEDFFETQLSYLYLYLCCTLFLYLMRPPTFFPMDYSWLSSIGVRSSSIFLVTIPQAIWPSSCDLYLL